MINQSLGQTVQNKARKELNRSYSESIVDILTISPDMTFAECRIRSDAQTKTEHTFVAAVILTPGISIPIDASTVFGLLHGDPRSPVGVQLVPKTVPEPCIAHSIPNATHGAKDDQDTPVAGRAVPDDYNIQQKINNRDYPFGRAMIFKPPTPLSQEYIGPNRITTESTVTYIDDPGAYMSVSEDEVRLIADRSNGILINPQSGISIYGKFNINTQIQDCRVQGAWRQNPMKQFMIPSTFFSPVPDIVWDPPGMDLIKGISSQITGIASSIGV